MNILYRCVQVSDAEKFYQMMKALDNETTFMLYEQDERIKNIPRLESMIESTINCNDLLWIATDADNNNEIVRYISAQRGKLNRIIHSAYIVVGIRKEYQHKRIGTTLFKKLDEWAMSNNIKRLELTVVSQNEAGVKLYEKSGFIKEGVKKFAMNINGEYTDEYYMAKIF